MYQKHATHHKHAAFQSLFKETVPTHNESDPSRLDDVKDQLTLKQFPKNIKWYPLYSDRPNTYQGDLMFEPPVCELER